jgi:hypothetical protein
MRRTRLLGLTVGVALLLVAPVARAEGPPAIDQYVESVPTAGGGKATKAHTAIAATTQHAIARSGGADAQLLTKVATSATYGAPTTRLRPASQRAEPAPPPSALGAVGAAAAVGSGGSRLAWLGLVLFGVTAVVLAAALRRSRSHAVPAAHRR